MRHKTDTINSSRRNLLGLGLAAFATGTVASVIPREVIAADDPIYTGFFSNKAVGGYDPVAYFTEGKPVKGLKAFRLEHAGVDWFFSSQENLDKFKAAPDEFAPQYGGYCAYAVGIGQTAKGDPQKWDIVDGKLYLNYDDNTRNLWLEKTEEYIVQGDANWPKVLE